MKSSGKSSSEIAEIFDVTVPIVYAWIKRYKENGIKGLETRPGQGRKPIMYCSDEEAVRKAIEEDRQSVSKACTNRALASVGTNLFVNYSYV